MRCGVLPAVQFVAHTFAAGGSSSESERELSVGTVEVVGLDAFDGVLIQPMIRGGVELMV